MPLLLPLLLVQSGFFPAFLLLYKMTSSAPDAASVWHLRSGLKPLRLVPQQMRHWLISTSVRPSLLCGCFRLQGSSVPTDFGLGS